MRFRWMILSVLAVVAALVLSACRTPLGRELTPASLADMDRLEVKVTDIPKVQYDAFIRAKAAGGDVAAAAEAAFKAGSERGEVKATPEEGSFLTGLLEVIALVFGGGATGTFLTRVLRGAPLASGSGVKKAEKAKK